jgi:hypothetical protein
MGTTVKAEVNMPYTPSNPYGVHPFIKAVVAGREFNIALWQWPADGAFASLYMCTRDAKSAVEGFHLAAATISADERRSALAKQEDRNAKGVEWLRTLGGVQRRLNNAAEALGQQRRKLSEVAPASPADAVIDCAIAQRLLALTNDAEAMGAVRGSLLSGADPRVTTAVLRLPAFLTGLSEQFVARVASAEIRRRAPREADEMESLGEALEAAQTGLRNAYGHIAKANPELPMGDQQKAMGDDAWEHLLAPERAQRLQNLKRLEEELGPLLHSDAGTDAAAPTEGAKSSWRERLAADLSQSESEPA